MDAPSPPRLSAAWQVEAFFLSAAFLCGGLFKLLSIRADACHLQSCLVVKELLKPNAVVHMTRYLATSIPPYGLANVNPY